MAVKGNDGGRFCVHIKNNRAGEMVFRTTPQRYRDAEARHSDLAARVDAVIDWDLDNFHKSMATAHGLVTWDFPTEDLARRAPNLKWIQIIGAGVEHLAPVDWLPTGVALINGRGIHTQRASEYGLMAILMLHGNMPSFYTQQRDREYESIFATSIAGRTLGVIGVGGMGSGIAKQAKRMGLHVLGVRHHGNPARNVDEMFGPDGIDEVMRRADFVVVAVPTTPQTIGLIDRRRIGLMKPTAGFVNLSRAPVVDYDALVERLEAGKLAGAILDVFEPEPLPPESPLWTTRNLIITPHVSGDDDTAYVPRTLDLMFDNIGRSLNSKPLRNRVRPKLGY